MKKLAPYLVLTAGILWGLIGSFVRVFGTYGLATMDIVTIRGIATFLLLFLFLLCFQRERLRVHLRDLWIFGGTGLLSIVFFNACYFQVITMTSLSVAAVLLYTAPAFVAFLSAVFFREKLTIMKLLTIAVTFFGCVLVTGVIGSEPILSPIGIVIGLGSGFGYALYSIFSRVAINKGYHPLTITFYTFLFSMIGTIPMSNMHGILSYASSVSGFFYCLLFGLVSATLPYILYTAGMQEMENSKASVLASIEPVTATIIGVIFYRETLTVLQMIGIVLVLSICFLPNLHPAKE